jgi:DNA-binding NarL/FixJ family response regulator
MARYQRSILIADDHPAIRQGIRTCLEYSDRWNVIGEACDGWDTIWLARETQPDIAILDYSMPGMSGLDLIRALRDELPRTEILIYTMHDQEKIVAEILRAGARGYVFKADDTAHLLSAVEALALHKTYFSPAISARARDYKDMGQSDDRGNTVLTPREREVVKFIAEGKINKQIAYMLGISQKTVETHRSTAMHKLKLQTTAELVLYAVRNDIVRL